MKPEFARGTERATDGTAGLARDAQGVPFARSGPGRVVHQDGFHERTVRQSVERLLGLATRRHPDLGLADGIEPDRVGQLGPRSAAGSVRTSSNAVAPPDQTASLTWRARYAGSAPFREPGRERPPEADRRSRVAGPAPRAVPTPATRPASSSADATARRCRRGRARHAAGPRTVIGLRPAAGRVPGAAAHRPSPMPARHHPPRCGQADPRPARARRPRRSTMSRPTASVSTNVPGQGAYARTCRSRIVAGRDGSRRPSSRRSGRVRSHRRPTGAVASRSRRGATDPSFGASISAAAEASRRLQLRRAVSVPSSAPRRCATIGPVSRPAVHPHQRHAGLGVAREDRRRDRRRTAVVAEATTGAG